ncbi:MAG: DUF11 domain-containing protein [Gemmataceae bacterium]|nr:DUF11 domain-containing protein [Gemmataceae bacterium]
MRRTLVSAITLVFALAVSLLAQPPRAVESQEPPLEKGLTDGMLKQAGAQLPLRGGSVPPTYAGAYTTPVVTVTVIAPAFIASNKDIEYTLRVENTSNLTARDVVIIHPLPAGKTIRKSDIPPTRTTQAGVEWDIGTLAGGQKKEIAVSVTPTPDMSEWHHVVRVRFEHGRQATTRLAKPELAVKIMPPTALQQTEQGILRLEVRNPGLLEVRDVQVTLALSDGVAFQYDAARPGQPAEPKNSPQLRTWTLPRLGPSEVRYLDARVLAEKGGNHSVIANALTATGSKATEAKATLAVQPPKLELTAAGPARRGSHQTATYKLTVRNAGNGILRNITVSDKLPAGSEVVTLSGGGQVFDRDVQWIISQLAPGETQTLELTTKAGGPGRHQHSFAARSQSLLDEKSVTTEFEQAAALRMDVRCEPESTTVGNTVRILITVDNTGSAGATNVRPALILPSSLTYVSADPPQHNHEGGRISFQPGNVAAGGRQVFTINAKAARPAIPAIVSAELAADQLEAGVIRRQESVAIGGQ